MGFNTSEINLLFIEDDSDSAQVIVEMLNQDTHTRFKIQHKTSLAESLKVLKDDGCDYDVVLLDLMLPNSAGFDTYESVRKVCSDLPIVIVSGYEDIACKCVRMGAQDYILKPDLSPGLIARSLKYAIERKNLETQRIKVENQYNSVIKHTPIGVHMYELIDDELYFTGYNPAADNILKIDHKPLVGMKIVEAFPNIGDIKKEYIKVIKTGESWSTDRVDYEDDQISGRFNVYAFRTEKNKMATTFEDITVKSIMRDKLRESQEKYKELVEVTRAGIYEIDLLQNKFIYVNDVLCKLTGWEKEELMNMKPTDILTPQSLQLFVERMDSLSKGEFIDPTFEYEVVVKDGSIKWTLITIKFKENEEGVVSSANVVAIDITNQKMAEEKAREKEQVIFEELENRLQVWKEEIVQTSLEQKDKIRVVNSNIQSIANGSVEVIQ